MSKQMPKPVGMEPLEKARVAARIANDAKAEDVLVLDVRHVSNITDYFVLLTGTSSTHVRAIGKRIEDLLRDAGIKPINVDGGRTTGWMVFDYGSVIVHAMTREIRSIYDLERLWGDAPQCAWSDHPA